MRMSPRARRYSRWVGWITAILSASITALFLAVLSIPGAGHYQGNSESDLWMYFGLCAIWALIVGTVAGGCGWVIGGIGGTMLDRSEADRLESLQAGSADFANAPAAVLQREEADRHRESRLTL